MNILILSTFPSDNPTHGGQHRLANTIRLLKEDGNCVQSIGVLGSADYPKSDSFVDYPPVLEFKNYIDNYFLMDDWAIGELFFYNDYYYQLLKNKIEILPDIIYVENVWLFKFAQRYIKEWIGKKHIYLVYGSENVENELKYNIVKTYMGHKIALEAKEKVFSMEVNAIKNADLVFCVSKEDVNWASQYSKFQPILAQNGVNRLEVNSTGIQEANKITGGHKFILYCASGHPPNISGFFEIFGNGIGCLPPDTKLVVAGSAGKAILLNEQFHKTAGLSKLFVDAGIVTNDCLRGLLELAHVVILPINQGGGTNLKTAEALLNGSFIVTTRKAMRGFESFLNDDGVFVSDTATEFCHHLSEVLNKEKLVLSNSTKLKRNVLLWEETLKDLVFNLTQLGEKS